MNTKHCFGIIRGKGVAGRVYIEATADLTGIWLFADAINFRALRARHPSRLVSAEIGNVVVFSGISADTSCRGIDTGHPSGQTLSRVASLIEVISEFPFPIETSIFQAHPICLDLAQAAKNNDIAKVKLHLEAGSDIDSADNKGNTALLYAVSGDNLAMVTLLSAYGADPFRENNNGVCPVGLAKEQHKNSLSAVLTKASIQCKSVAKINAYFAPVS